MVAGRAQVLIADDNPSVRENLRALIDFEPTLECIGVARSGAECLELTRARRPEILVLDRSLRGSDGVEIAAMLAEDLSGTRVVLYTLDEDVADLKLPKNVIACVSKTAPLETLMTVLRDAARASEPDLDARSI